MYAFSPQLKRAPRRPRNQKFISETLVAVIGAIPTLAGVWAGMKIADLISYLYDQEEYWREKLAAAQLAASEAQENIRAIEAARQQAEAEQHQSDDGSY